MCTYSAELFAGREVGVGERMVGGDAVEDRGGERPLEVENGGFGVAGKETIIGVGSICSPEGWWKE